MEMLSELRLRLRAKKRPWLGPFVLAIFMLVSCDHKPEEWKTPNMTPFTPRLKSMFEKTKTVCFGRFMVDVPASTEMVWGNSSIGIYPDGAGEVENLAKKFIDELKSEKAIYLNDVPLLLSIDQVTEPEGQIVTGYEGFGAINGLKMHGYFRLNNDGVVIERRPLKDEREETVAEILSDARRLRQRVENDIPAEPGNCIEYGFLLDKPNPSTEDLKQHVRIGFRLKEIPDAHLSIYIGSANPHNPEGASLKRQWDRMFDEATPEEKKMLANTRFFRRSPRQIHEWQTGYEVLVRSAAEEGVHAYHDFQVKFTGVPHDVFRPYADVKFQTGVADNAAGATRASLTDEEAIAVWDKITSTIRVRPTRVTAANTVANQKPRLPLGELAATGRTCPQTGLWDSGEPSATIGTRRRYIKSGETMPHVVVPGEPSLWQKIKGDRPTHRLAAVWKLVASDDVPAAVDPNSLPPVAQSAPESIPASGSVDGMASGSPDAETSPKGKA